MNLTSRFDNLDTLIAEDRLVRRAWTRRTDDGRELACLLAALSPEVAKSGSSLSCPADLMPPWLAKLTPWIDDAGSLAEWPGVVRRYAAVARRWGALDALAWAKLQWQVRGICVREAVQHTKRPDVIAACERVIALCDTGARDGEVDERERAAAAYAADAAAAYAADAAYAYAADAAYAYAAAAYAAAAYAAAAYAAAAYAAAADAAREAAADRIISRILAAIERACDVAEGKSAES